MMIQTSTASAHIAYLLTRESSWKVPIKVHCPHPLAMACAYIHSKKRFVILTIVFLTRIDMVLWDDTRIVPCDSQLIQCTWSSYRNNWMLL